MATVEDQEKEHQRRFGHGLVEMRKQLRYVWRLSIDTFTVLLNATTRRDWRGNVTGVAGVGQDTTALNQMLAQSERVADDLTRLIETANAPIFGIDTFGKITEWNAKASSLLGSNKDEAVGEHLVQRFITEEFKASVSEVLDSALVGKETANFEFPMFTKLASVAISC